MFDIEDRARVARYVARIALLGVFGCAGGASPDAAPTAEIVDPIALGKEPLVPIVEVDPRIRIDARYATADTFTGRAL